MAALASATAHTWMAWLHWGSWWEAGLMAVMAVSCLPCALPLWRSGCTGAARMLMGMALAMAGFHLLLVLQPVASGTHSHHAPAVQTAPPGPPDMAGAMLAIIALELASAMMAATWIRRSAGGNIRVLERTPTETGRACRLATSSGQL
ncbi:hypothetical protein D477_012655 [Arthrobacter crystallopoietes BAB-32]|uniref:Uncharacterized protein n=1 Tax=Arthrobacter crystallopoietes BAB-32 TaxID=1246476 RepID=N1UXU3_9MICC|nr:hypothetical protein [Arthrobacter crystallopoietes]EMY33865.1 hypothetical protein D477_012655 [Arthrobacter crystallopoietes BAB-32]